MDRAIHTDFLINQPIKPILLGLSIMVILSFCCLSAGKHQRFQLKSSTHSVHNLLSVLSENCPILDEN
jgi:hypothetical protein